MDSQNDINALLEPTKNLSEKWRLVTSYVKTRGLVKQQIESFNYFVTQGMQKIVEVELDLDIGSTFAFPKNLRHQKKAGK